MRKLLYLLGIIIISTCGLWWIWIKPTLESRLHETLKPFAPNLGKNDLKVIPFGIKLNELGPSNSPFPIKITEPTLRLSLMSILTLSPQIHFSAQVLGSNLHGLLKTDRGFNDFKGHAKISSLDLIQHPLIKLSGLTSGLVNADADFGLTALSGATDLNIDITATNLKVSKSQMLPSLISKYPIFIPAFSEGEINIKFECYKSSCKSQNLKFYSSLGIISGQSVLNLDNPKNTIETDLTFSLTKSGRDSILPLLGLIRPDIVNTQAQKIALKISGSLDRPNVSVVAINQAG